MIAETVTEMLRVDAPRAAAAWEAWVREGQSLNPEVDEVLFAFVASVMSNPEGSGSHPRVIGGVIRCVAAALADCSRRRVDVDSPARA